MNRLKQMVPRSCTLPNSLIRFPSALATMPTKPMLTKPMLKKKVMKRPTNTATAAVAISERLAARIEVFMASSSCDGMVGLERVQGTFPPPV